MAATLRQMIDSRTHQEISLTTNIQQILDRIDDVLNENRRTEFLFIGMVVLLFLAGMGCLVSAIWSGQFAWATPSIVTTALLHYPMKEIKELRQKNIALATAPLLINTLPTDQAAAEMGKLLASLYGHQVPLK
jgi:hypothetical protein